MEDITRILFSQPDLYFSYFQKHGVRKVSIKVHVLDVSYSDTLETGREGEGRGITMYGLNLFSEERHTIHQSDSDWAPR